MFYSKQFVFQNEHATEHVIIQLVDRLLHSFEENKFTLGVIRDSERAFGRTDHSALLKKLSLCDIKRTSL